MTNLLLEFFSEEIPARMQNKAEQNLHKIITNALCEMGITYVRACSYATPRRLCLAIWDLSNYTPSKTVERKGPHLNAPAVALDGFLRSCGVNKNDLRIGNGKKGKIYIATIKIPPRPVSEILAQLIPEIVRKFPWPKSMRWEAKDLRWVRPLRSIICILTDNNTQSEVINFKIDGLKSGNTTAGHRFHASGKFTVHDFNDYVQKLKKSYVILDAQTRANKIMHDAHNLVSMYNCKLVEDADLLAEVTGLVEWPVILIGNIDAFFWDLPPKILQTSMRKHQKFFSVQNKATNRIEKFIAVANRQTDDQGKTIIKGYQKVLSARLADARFFWHKDLDSLQSRGQKWYDELTRVTFHAKLGSQADRITRVVTLARTLAPILNVKTDIAAAAAWFAKLDLASNMVKEFPELQGIIGQYYAHHAGMPPEVALATQEHYSPLGPGDFVPTQSLSVTVALADKLDTLSAFWRINEKPTGSKDPFALRRASLGVIRLILENKLRIKLKSVLMHDKKNRLIINELMDFFHERLKVYLRGKDIDYDVIDACLAVSKNDDFTLLVRRIRALQAFIISDAGRNLLQRYKRTRNILLVEQKKNIVVYKQSPDKRLAETENEKNLFIALDIANTAITVALESEDFVKAMDAISRLRGAIDNFFNTVRINDAPQFLRLNRLYLLHKIFLLIKRVADFDKLNR